jgi:hypothetical protein
MRRHHLPFIRTLAVTLGVLLAAPGLAGADDPEGAAFFERKIRPVLIEHCYACHSSQAKPPKAGFRVDTRAGLRRGGHSGPAIEPGRPDDSLLIRVLEHTSEIAMMPPDGRLPDAVLDDFRAWIERGAPDPRPEDPPR